MGQAVDRLVAWVKLQYDKLIAFLVLFFLVVSLLYLAVRATMVPGIQRAFEMYIDNVRPTHERAAEVETTRFKNAHEEVEKPYQIIHQEWTNELPAAAFVPERRVWCVDCKFPIPYVAMACWFCGADQPPIEDDIWDSDEDGMSDEWEEDHDFDPLDAKDGEEDADGDGFSNVSEFRGKTDPRDPKSFPPIIDVITLSEIRPDPFHLKFVGKVVLPDGKLKFQLNTRRGSRTVWVRMGESTPDGFTVVDYEEKTEVQNETVKINVDVSLLTLKRGSKHIILVKGREEIHKEYKALLVLKLMGEDPIECLVKEDTVFKLKKKEYKVLSIDNADKIVTIRNVETGAEKDIVE